jgi:hypothetical protein
LELEPDPNKVEDAFDFADAHYEKVLRIILAEMQKKYPDSIDTRVFREMIRTKWKSQKFDQDEILVRKAIVELIEEAIAATLKLVKPELDHIGQRVRVFDGSWHEVTDAQFKILKALFDANGGSIQGSGLGCIRPDKIIKRMKEPVKRLITITHQNGYSIPSLLPQ